MNSIYFTNKSISRISADAHVIQLLDHSNIIEYTTENSLFRSTKMYTKYTIVYY